MSVFRYEKDQDGIVTVTMDMSGEVNAINEEYKLVMAETVAKLEKETRLTGVVLSSAKKTFFAGGDLKELAAIKPGTEQALFEDTEKVKSVLRRLEKLPVPVVAAINGAALGGGYEICLCCHRRIAWDDKSVQIGLPEVSLGLLPGGGGVVRLTKLLGLEKALPFLLEGKKVNAGKALQAGLIDDTVATLDDLIPQAKSWILENQDNAATAVQPWDKKPYTIPGGHAASPQLQLLLQTAPILLRKKTRGLLPAPEYILNVAVEASRLDVDTALRIESRYFASLTPGAEAKNMVNAFFFQMRRVRSGGSRPKNIKATSVKKVGIVGAGMMGRGIAAVSAMAGLEVVLKDISLETAKMGKSYTEKLLDKKLKREQIDEAAKTATLSLIHATENSEDLQGCDVIIEAVFENKELKDQITMANESYLSGQGIWASNTSTLPITRLAQASRQAECFIGLHFFSPVDRMSLVEIIRGKQTSDDTLAKAFDFVRQINKTGIVVNDSPGFFTSRVFATMLFEAAQLVAEGVHPIRIDAMGKAIGMPVGPLTSMDEVSLNLALQQMETLEAMGLRKPDEDPTPEASKLIMGLAKEHGRGGRHHGGGYYEYNEDGKTIWPRLIELFYKSELVINDQDIKDRLLFRPVIESLKCLQEGVLGSVADGNIGSILGIGAPVWTGGYIQFVNTYGLGKFIDRCEDLSNHYGDRFRTPPIVAQKLAREELFD